MPTRSSTLFLAVLLAAAPLAGCQSEPATGGAAGRAAGQVQTAVQQQYRAGMVDAIVREQNGASRLEVTLINPSGQEATTQEAARALGGTARRAYDGGALDAVRVSFEYTSESGPAEVGFHRRYTFPVGELEGARDTTAAAPPDSAAASLDSASARQQ